MTDGLETISQYGGDLKFHLHERIEPNAADRWKQYAGGDALSEMTRHLASSLGYSSARLIAAMPRASLTRLAINYTKRGAWDPGCAPLVLVHGLAASSAFWLRVSEEISALHPVLLYDLRGHGRSAMPPSHYSAPDMADDLIELLDFLGVNAATLAGHSFGGGVALHAALRWPGRLDGLVLADTRLNYFQPRMTPASWPNWEQRKLRLQEIGIEIRG